MHTNLIDRLIRLADGVRTPPLESIETMNLAHLKRSEVTAWFHSPKVDQQWNEVATHLAGLYQIQDGATGGVNPGDRRALFYIASAIQANSILEIGSHVGASTVHLATAIKPGARLTTVDFLDVNDGAQAYWRGYGLKSSPRQMLSDLKRDIEINFIVSDSVSFLKTTDQKFDLVFLDGDHSRNTVLREVPWALRRLNKNGVIVLHDYFPNNRPLWSNGKVISGPFKAIEKLIANGAALKVIPLGALPWPTKLGSHVTSLAIVSSSN
jgi:predicted O-methyltransferase YrrM